MRWLSPIATFWVLVPVWLRTARDRRWRGAQRETAWSEPYPSLPTFATYWVLLIHPDTLCKYTQERRGGAQRPELRPMQPCHRCEERDSRWNQVEHVSRFLRKITLCALLKTAHLPEMPVFFFLILLIVSVVEDGIKVVLFFHKVSLQNLALILVNFSLEIIVLCLKTICI